MNHETSPLDHHARLLATKDARVAELEHTLKVAQESYAEVIAASEARVAALVGALRRYGMHEGTCMWCARPPRPCTCGLDEALAAAVPQPPREETHVRRDRERWEEWRRESAHRAAQGMPPKEPPTRPDPGPAVPQGELPREKGPVELQHDGERNARVMRGEPTPAPQRDEHDGWTCRHCNAVGNGGNACYGCGRLHVEPSEAPPAGEQTPEGIARAVVLLNEMREWGTDDVPDHVDLILAALAAQPAPASHPRDESVSPPGDTMAYYRVLPMRWGRRGEITGWYIDVDPPHAPFATREAAIAHCEQHRARILAGYAPTVSREVDEAAVRARVEQEIAEAFVGCGEPWHADFVRSGTYRGRDERPAASGKDGAT